MDVRKAMVPIFACSPRGGGNTDTAAAIVAEVLEAKGIASDIVRLREHKLMPCQGCNYCGTPGHACILAKRDDCERLLRLLYAAPAVFWLAPIFFYHLPAQSKALIDRAQAYWYLKRNQDPGILALPPRQAHALLIAARSKGEKLFQGSLSTLRYFFEPFNIDLAEPLLITGLDGPQDLARAPEQANGVTSWATAALARDLG